MLWTSDLRVECASLTGASVAVVCLDWRTAKYRTMRAPTSAVTSRDFPFPSTGESEPVALGTVSQSSDPVDSRNVAFNSSLVMNGEGVGVVTATGDNTMIGTVARLASTTASKRTTMQIEIDRIVFRLTILAVSMVSAKGRGVRRRAFAVSQCPAALCRPSSCSSSEHPAACQSCTLSSTASSGS